MRIKGVSENHPSTWTTTQTCAGLCLLDICNNIRILWVLKTRRDVPDIQGVDANISQGTGQNLLQITTGCKTSMLLRLKYTIPGTTPESLEWDRGKERVCGQLG